MLVPLREAADFILYRGRQHGDPSPILAVAPATKHPSPQSLRRLEHEYLLASVLDPAWAAKPLALTRHEGRTILVLADPGGEPLDRVLERDRLERGKEQPLDLVRLLRLAISLAMALGNAHQRGLIHKDVKPENVLVDDAGHVWLTGFGIASRLPRERQAPAPLEIVAGTVAYMSPEQTGRMNRSMDTRSDLYSLGVTLYQMLTGVLPFAAADPLEWVHCHIARQPVAPVDRGAVPEPLSAITMRLLAKNAEERYQTAAGVEADLRRCLSEWQSHGRIDPFPLGTDDSSDRLLIPEKLYGREREVDALLAAFDQVVAQGTAELVLVSGHSGVGKSSVVNELHKVLVPRRGLFAAGKFDQYKREVPYATLAQAFQMLVREILGKSEAEVDHLRHALMDALGPNGQLMVNLIPEVEFIIGKQPPVAELPPQEARGRFQLVFRRFLGAFARPEHPLALFLDDLQWLDTATLELLEGLATDPDVRHVLLIGAYRDNEVNSSHPLMRTLAGIRDAGARVREIVLAPLGLDDFERLVADALRRRRNSATALALLIHEKTGGNPFFAIQLLTALVEEGLLRFDRDAAGWIWDLDRIRAKGYSDNVVDLMLGKLRRLSETTQAALQRLACLGNVAEIATLSVILGQSEEEIHTAFLDAVHTGLILRLGDSYAFLHDRIQEAAYELIPESARAEVHLRIGRALLASLTTDGVTEHLFLVANQLNRGAALLVDHDEKVKVAVVDLRAGRKAKASAAYASALSYFAAGMSLSDERDWSSQYELTFSLWLERAECEFLTGHLDTAEQLVAELLPRGASKVDEAAVYRLMVQLHVMKSDYQRAMATALTCLRRLGIDLPALPTEEQVQAEYEALWQTLSGRPIESLIDLPLMTDPERQAAMQVLSLLLIPAYITDYRFFCLQVCRMVRINLQHGTSGDSATGYVFLGIVLGWRFRRYDEGYRFAKLACDLVEKHAFIASQAKVYCALAQVAFWTQPIAAAIDLLGKGFCAAIETGDPTYASLSMAASVTHFLLRNDPLDVVWSESEMALDFARKARYGDAADCIVSQQRFIATMQGRTATFSTFSDAQFDEATFEAQLTGGRNPQMICWYWILKLNARFLSGDHAEALAAADKAKQLLGATAHQLQLLNYFFYTALTVSALYENASAQEQQAWRELLRAHREQLREWAENCPPTFADKHTLVLAEIARLEKRDADALQLYEQAIHLAREHGFVQNEGLAHELAAQYYLAHGLETAGYAHLRNALNCYDRWGALGKVRQLNHLYPHLKEESPTPGPAGRITAPVELLDLSTVIKVSQAVSGEMVLEKLIDSVMRAAIEHAGAERGLLILPRDAQLQIEAEATTRGDGVIVHLRDASTAAAELPESLVRYVLRAQENVILEDALSGNSFSADPYIVHHRARSILCLPLINRAKLIGVLYLENKLTPHVFTTDRITALKVLASQAAVSLENTRLYRDLENREAKIRRLVEANVVGIVVGDLEGRILEANDAFLRIVGYDREDLASGRLRGTDLTPAEYRDRDERAIVELKANGVFQPYEKEYFRKDGSRVPILQGGALFEDSGNEVVAFILNLSEQRRTEEALRRTETYLTQAQRLSHTGSWAYNPAMQKALYWSDEMFRICGFDPQQGPPTSEAFLERVHPEDRESVAGTMRNAAREKTEYRIEHRIIHPNGTIKHTQAIGHPVLDRSGNVVEFVGSAVDITDAKYAEQERERLRQELAHLAQMNRVSVMGEMAASLAHEIRQPITAATTNAQICLWLLERDKLDVSEMRETTSAVVQSVKRAADIIERVRSLSKKSPQEHELVDVNQVVREIDAMLRNESSLSSVTTNLQLSESVPQVKGDRVQLQQVVMNLMLNAIEAMRDSGGELVVTSERTDSGQVLVSVSDSGVGLPVGKEEHIFDAFFTTKTQGTGMGLAISRSIVESHGGRLWAKSNTGHGSTFYFELPRHEPKVA